MGEQQERSMGDNILAHMEGDDLILRINTKKDFGIKPGGKMIKVAQSPMFVSVPFPEANGLVMNIYAGRMPKEQ